VWNRQLMSERRIGFGWSGVSEGMSDVGRSWRTRKGALKARGRQRADPWHISVYRGAVSKERLRVFEAETEVQERDRSRAFTRMLGAEPTALPLRAPGWACSPSANGEALS
jgi:hypothetical protein